MNREIKFRAFYDNQMLDVCGIEDTDLAGIIVTMSLPYKFNRKAGIGSLELMQYTGLKDINGKEIYEGDIVRYSIFGKTMHDEVGFSNGMFTVGEGINKRQLAWMGFDDLMVAGNIHENPELLSKTGYP